MKKDNLGCFVSLTAPTYLVKVYENARENKANSVMFYLGSPRRSQPISFDKLCFSKYKENGFDKKLGMGKMVVHAPYVINPASNNPQIQANTLRCLTELMSLMSKLGIPLMVLHPGSATEQTREEGINNLIKCLKQLLKVVPDVTIAIENMVAKSTLLCNTFEELAELLEKMGSERIGICLDTCHLWDYGYDVKNIEEIVEKLKNLNLLERLKVIHLNDSKYPRYSNRDVHANLGEGTIGLEPLKQWAQHPAFKNIPIILETPEGKYKEELASLRE